MNLQHTDPTGKALLMEHHSLQMTYCVLKKNIESHINLYYTIYIIINVTGQGTFLKIVYQYFSRFLFTYGSNLPYYIYCANGF